MPQGHQPAQKAELVALSKALELGKGKKLSVHTDSHYTFSTALIHVTIYREQGLLTSEGKTIKNKQEILDLLCALWLPIQLAIIHCPGHQKGTGLVPTGNNLANETAKKVAMSDTETVMAILLPDPGPPNLPKLPKYTPDENNWTK